MSIQNAGTLSLEDDSEIHDVTETSFPKGVQLGISDPLKTKNQPPESYSIPSLGMDIYAEKSGMSDLGLLFSAKLDGFNESALKNYVSSRGTDSTDGTMRTYTESNGVKVTVSREKKTKYAEMYSKKFSRSNASINISDITNLENYVKQKDC